MAPLPRIGKRPWYVATPRDGAGPGILLLHSWWGLDQTFREMADQLAAAGFSVVAPDLLHGAKPQSRAPGAALPGESTWKLLVRAAEHAREISLGLQLGVIGFSMGGHWALWLAQQNLVPAAATVVFYGARTGDFRASRSAFQFHFANDDPYVSEAAKRQLRRNLTAARRPAEFYNYPGTGHWFVEPGREDAYNPEASDLAWERTVGFLRSHLPWSAAMRV